MLPLEHQQGFLRFLGTAPAFQNMTRDFRKAIGQPIHVSPKELAWVVVLFGNVGAVHTLKPTEARWNVFSLSTSSLSISLRELAVSQLFHNEVEVISQQDFVARKDQVSAVRNWIAVRIAHVQIDCLQMSNGRGVLVVTAGTTIVLILLNRVEDWGCWLGIVEATRVLSGQHHRITLNGIMRRRRAFLFVRVECIFFHQKTKVIVVWDRGSCITGKGNGVGAVVVGRRCPGSSLVTQQRQGNINWARVLVRR
mmetsp:Transcript_22502/g.62459  ORF Transcript_22502/g.62459 Transcript_22502/m.62459 type:complete len:252 (+) Transcript_22502:345-1100(+)